MSPQRIEELAWHACNECAMTVCTVTAFDQPMSPRTEAMAFRADIAAAIRTAVREALDAAQIVVNRRMTAHGGEDGTSLVVAAELNLCATEISRLRDELTAEPPK